MAINKIVKDGKTTYTVFVKVRDSLGKQKAKVKKGITSEVKAKKLEYMMKLELEGYKSRMIWSKWTEKCLERFKVEYRNSTYLNYKHTLDKWINPVLKDQFLDSITPSMIHDFIFNHVSGVSHWTRKGILKRINRVFNMTLEDGVITKNPAAKVKVKVPQVAQKVLSQSEVKVLLSEAKSVGHRFYEIWTLALLTGMRSGELYALKWDKIDFEKGFINVTSAWTKMDGFGSTKSAKNRMVPISVECSEFLKELKLTKAKTDFVLPRRWEWQQGNQAAVLKDFCKGLDITPVKFHDLRATFITQLLKNGVPLAKVMSMVGHANLKTTQGYLRLSGEDLIGATDKLNFDIPKTSEAKVLEFKSI